jgi:sarcosine oxidase
MGGATAWQLRKRGLQVALLEQLDAGHVHGSSHGAARIFRFAYDDVEYVRMAQRALALWHQLEGEAGEPLLDITGGIDHGPARDIEHLSSVLSSVDVPHEVITGPEADARFPEMRFDELVLLHPDGGRCRADATVGALQRLSACQFDTHVDTIDGTTVRAGEDTWEADVVVVAAGAWLSKLLPHVDLPALNVTREQVVHFNPIGSDEMDWPSFIHRQANGVGIYGLTSPGEGVKVAEHHVGPVVDPDSRTFALDAAGVDRIVTYVEEWFPGLDPVPINPATCLYTNTPNEDFLLDRVDDIVIVSPCSGHGFKFAPEIGRLAADLALGQPPEHDRFTLAAHARWSGTARHL